MQAAKQERLSPPAEVREAVRALLTANADFQALPSETRREMAQGLVKICAAALSLSTEEAEAAKAALAPPSPAFATAQSAGSEFSGVAAQRVADTTRQILNAVSFPRFVTELINGVFKALVDTNQQQLTSYVELIGNIATSTEGFAEANVGLDGARRWLVERFPGSFVVEGEEDPFAEPGQRLSPEEQAERDAETRLRLRPGASMPSEAALRAGLGLGAAETIPTGDPESLAPVARMAMARNRQQMLSTMVMMGLQRIVIESGRLHASMRFHIDTRSAAQEDRGSAFDARHSSTLSGSFGYGPWGASAAMTNTIGYVSTQQTQTTEEMNTDLDLNSSVELVFKTDYLPLDRLAGREQVDRIKVNTLNPEAEAKAAAEARGGREKRYAESEGARRDALAKRISSPPAAPAAPKAGEPGSGEAAEKARKEAAKKQKAAERTKPSEAGSAKKAAPTTQAGLAFDASEEDGTQTLRVPDVIFVPTIDEAADEMLALARVTSKDLVYDLGCGDGRIVVAAARKCGCRAIGIDIDPQRVEDARRRVEREGLEHLVRIEQGDIFQANLRDADVIMLYLLPHLNVKLIPQLRALRPGCRIVSQDFAMNGVVPDRVVQVFLPWRQIKKTFYLWTTPLTFTRAPVPSEWSNANPLTVD